MIVFSQMKDLTRWFWLKELEEWWKTRQLILIRLLVLVKTNIWLPNKVSQELFSSILVDANLEFLFCLILFDLEFLIVLHYPLLNFI